MTATTPTPDQLLTQLADLAAAARAAGVDAADISRATQTGVIPDLTVVVVRDPDGNDDVTVFADNEPCSASTIVVDAGRGWSPSEWQNFVDSSLESTSGPLREHLQEVLTAPPGDDYIDQEAS
ncbi:hypothetical protein [Gordonia aichiensis]|uniref:hypothetical protein n=1 Tax=Gordonia aichiensis TaxID=36820 RepID=UPI003265640D